MALWGEMVERLLGESTSVAEIAECSDEVLGDVLKDLGFGGLQRAKLQTEWAKRVGGVGVERGVGAGELRGAVIDDLAMDRIDRVTNPFCEDNLARHCTTTNEVPAKLWLRPDYSEDPSIIDAALVSGFSQAMCPIYVSRLPPPQTHRILLCTVAVSGTESYEDGHIYALHSPTQLSPHCLVTVSSTRAAPVQHRELVSPSCDVQSLRESSPLPPPPPVLPLPPVQPAPIIAKCTKTETLRLLSETKKLVGTMAVPVVYIPPVLKMSPSQVEEARRYAEMEIIPPTPPRIEEEQEEEEEQQEVDTPMAAAAEAAPAPKMTLDEGTKMSHTVKTSDDNTARGTPTTATRRSTDMARATAATERSTEIARATGRSTEMARATGRSTDMARTTTATERSTDMARAASHSKPMTRVATGRTDDDPDLSKHTVATLRSSLKTAEASQSQLKTVAMGLDFPLQPASRTTTAPSESELSLGDKLLQTVGASTMEGITPQEMPLDPEVQEVQDHVMPYEGGVGSATISSAKSLTPTPEPEPFIEETIERPPRERVEEYKQLFKQNMTPIKEALVTGDPRDVVQEVVDDGGWPYPMPPSPTPKLNPLMLRDDNKTEVEAEPEDTDTQPMEEWELKVQQALSRIKTLDVGSRQAPCVRRSGVVSNCFTPGSAYTGRSTASTTPIRTPPNAGRSFLVNERRHLSPARGGPSMKSHEKTSETVETTAKLLDTVTGGVALAEGVSMSTHETSFGDTLQKIEACTKADFDSVSAKLDALKGKMEATHQSWKATSPMKMAEDRWQGADLPGGLWGPAYKAFAEDYHRVLEPM